MGLTAIQSERIHATLAIQFSGVTLDDLVEEVKVSISRKTGRIRGISDKQTGDRLFSLRTSDGRFLPTYEGGRRLLDSGFEQNRIVMMNEAAPFVATGKSAFCKHVVAVDDTIVPYGEVLVLDEDNNYLAVGTARQPGYAMLHLNRGVAAQIKHARDKQ